MRIVDEPVGIISADDALLYAQCVDLAIRVRESRDRVRVAEDDPMRVALATLVRLATFRTEHAGIPPVAPVVMVRTVSVKDAAARLNVTERAVRGRCERGSLRAVKTADGWRIFADQFDDQEDEIA